MTSYPSGLAEFLPDPWSLLPDLLAAIPDLGGILAGALGVVVVAAGVLVIGPVALVTGLRLRARRRSRKIARVRSDAEARSDRERELEAGSALVRLDDAVRASEDELGFAEAEFGTEQLTPIRGAVARARTRLSDAFAIRQRLDDAVPETAVERRELTARILELCRSGETSLREQESAIGRLRAVERDAVALLDTLDRDAARLADRIATAERLVAELRSLHGDGAVEAIAENPAHARRVGDYASSRLAAARVTRSDPSGEVDGALQEARRAFGQVDRLLGAVETRANDLRDIGARLDAAVADARADLALARSATPTPALTAAVAETERVLAAVPAGEQTVALAELERADAALERALADTRGTAAREERVAGSLPRLTEEARSAVAAARDYIATRRGGVGAAARTRLSEAESRLTDAIGLASADPVAALESAQESRRLAESALELARTDVVQYPQQAAPDPRRGPSEMRDLEELGGALIGGILKSVLGGRRH